ncbi:MAG: DUF1203 domain-containing protein [Pseudomonadota bacterium]
MTFRIVGLETDIVRKLQAGGVDCHGQTPEKAVSDGQGKPCRHCLCEIPAGEEMLILAHRPFPSMQPYAESGPIFLCAKACTRWEGDGLPPIFAPASAERLVKGYSPDDRIVYGLGKVVPITEISDRIQDVLDDPRVAYVHIRSSTNNCFSCRAERV